MNNDVGARCWHDSNHDGRYWYDGPLNGYYMRPGVRGLRRDDETPVHGFENAVVSDFASFVSLVRGIVWNDATTLI